MAAHGHALAGLVCASMALPDIS